MSITISLLHSSEWKEYKTIRLEALKEDPKAFGSSYEKESYFSDKEWQEKLRNPDNSIVIAKDNKIPVGMVGYHLKSHQEHGHLWGMFVSKTYRGQGVGKHLIQAIIKKIKSLHQVKKIFLDVNPEQQAAVRLYESIGFVQAGTTMYVMGDGKERELLTLELRTKNSL